MILSNKTELFKCGLQASIKTETFLTFLFLGLKSLSLSPHINLAVDFLVLKEKVNPECLSPSLC